MRLISFSHAGASSFGLAEGGGVIDVGARTRGRFADLAGALAEPEALAGLRPRARTLPWPT